MTIFQGISELVAVIVLCWLWRRIGRREGYERGRGEGAKPSYTHGWNDGFEAGLDVGKRRADNWWMGVEAEIERERRRMWEKEKGKRSA